MRGLRLLHRLHRPLADGAAEQPVQTAALLALVVLGAALLAYAPGALTFGACVSSLWAAVLHLSVTHEQTR